MPKNYGWAEMPVMGYIEGSSNVRPIIQKCHDENKSGILHYVLNTRMAACGGAQFLSSFLNNANKKILIPDPRNSEDKLLTSCLICDVCEGSPEWTERERDIE